MMQTTQNTTPANNTEKIAMKHGGKMLSSGEELAEGHVAVILLNCNHKPAYSFSKKADAKAFEAELTVVARTGIHTNIIDNHILYNKLFATKDL